MTATAPPPASAPRSVGERAMAVALRALVRATIRPTFSVERTFVQQRARLARVARLSRPPRGLVGEPARLGGVPGEWISGVWGTGGPRVILYLHGGGYCVGGVDSHRALAGHLSLHCRSRVFVAGYRLAPEHPFPAALDDAVKAYLGLLGQETSAQDIAVAGDSAGGGLSVATAVALRDRGAPLPRALVCFSPWADLSLEQLGPPPPGEVMLRRPWIEACAKAYLGGARAAEPLASPIGADLRGLPPTLIQVGSDELLLTDSRRLHARLKDAGVAAHIEEYPGRWHVFQANAGWLKDADRALGRVARFLEDPPAARA
jgi:monoterpene epsilon-lactone hydrolase